MKNMPTDGNKINLVEIPQEQLEKERNPNYEYFSIDEPKQENCCTPEGQIKRYVDCKGCDRKPKEETLEEAFSNYVNERYHFPIRDSYPDLESAKFGVKWQQQRTYSEEEVIEFTMNMISQYVVGNTNIWDRDRLKESLSLKKL